jgi:hypothetical protein
MFLALLLLLLILGQEVRVRQLAGGVWAPLLLLLLLLSRMWRVCALQLQGSRLLLPKHDMLLV